MPDVTSHAAGTPSWVDLGTPEIEAAAAFYSGLLGWEVSEAGPEEETGGYRMCTLRGRPVAGLGPQQAPGAPYWTTYVTVADVDASVAVIRDAGSVLAEPFDVMTAGRMAVCADPGGAAFAVWQPKDSIGAEIVNEPGALCWNELTTRHVSEAKQFYPAIFGWEPHEHADSSYVEWHLEGRSIGGMMPMEGDMWPADLPDHWMVYFAVDDTDATATKAEQLGGAVSVPPTDIPTGRFSVLNDPHGAVFSVIRLAQQPAT